MIKLAMNVKQTRAAIRALGLSATRTDGEWRVAFSFDNEATAYYTTDNDDALRTAAAMAAEDARAGRTDLIDKVAAWLSREPKADIATARRLYDLTPDEVQAVERRMGAAS